MSVSSTIVNATNTVENDINSYLPLGTSAVLSVEQTMASAPAQSKLTTALGIIMDGAKVGEAIPNPGVAAISSLIDMIDSIVSAFNAAGLFSHKSSTTASIAPTVNTLAVPAAVPATPQVATSGALAGVATVQPAAQTAFVPAAPVAHESVLGKVGHGIADVFTGKAEVKV